MLFLTEITSGNKFQIYALGTENNCPFEDFVDEANAVLPNEWPKLLRLIEHTKDNGPIHNERQSKKLKGYEFNEFITKGGLRLFYFFDSGRLLICTTGFIKQGDGTPRRELTKADEWRKRYFEAKQKNQIKIVPLPCIPEWRVDERRERLKSQRA